MSWDRLSSNMSCRGIGSHPTCHVVRHVGASKCLSVSLSVEVTARLDLVVFGAENKQFLFPSLRTTSVAKKPTGKRWCRIISNTQPTNPKMKEKPRCQRLDSVNDKPRASNDALKKCRNKKTQLPLLKSVQPDAKLLGCWWHLH